MAWRHCSTCMGVHTGRTEHSGKHRAQKTGHEAQMRSEVGTQHSRVAAARQSVGHRDLEATLRSLCAHQSSTKSHCAVAAFVQINPELKAVPQAQHLCKSMVQITPQLKAVAQAGQWQKAWPDICWLPSRSRCLEGALHTAAPNRAVKYSPHHTDSQCPTVLATLVLRPRRPRPPVPNTTHIAACRGPLEQWRMRVEGATGVSW